MILSTICAGREFQTFTILLKEKMFRFVRSKTVTNDLEAIVTSGACEIGSYIVVYVDIVKATNNSSTSIRSSGRLCLNIVNNCTRSS